MRISKRSQQKFADLAAGYGTLAKIREVFLAEDFTEAPDIAVEQHGARRSQVDAFEAIIDLHDPDQQSRLLKVYLSAIEDWGIDQSTGVLVEDARVLIKTLKRDGAPIDDNGNLIAPLPRTLNLRVDNYKLLADPDVLEQHLDRINRSIKNDPADVIGASKELVESVCKLVLDDYGVNYDRNDDFPSLYKKTAKALAIDRGSVPKSAKGSASAKKVLQNLSTVVRSMSELRNLLGTGHGRSERSPAAERHARLAFNAARTLAEFLLDTWHDRRST